MRLFARTYSSYVDLFKYITTSLMALTIVLNIRMAGVVLVISLLTIPPNIAMLFTRVYFKNSCMVGYFRFHRNSNRIRNFILCWNSGRSYNNIYTGNNLGNSKRNIRLLIMRITKIKLNNIYEFLCDTWLSFVSLSR